MLLHGLGEESTALARPSPGAPEGGINYHSRGGEAFANVLQGADLVLSGGKKRKRQGEFHTLISSREGRGSMREKLIYVWRALPSILPLPDDESRRGRRKSSDRGKRKLIFILLFCCLRPREEGGTTAHMEARRDGMARVSPFLCLYKLEDFLQAVVPYATPYSIREKGKYSITFNVDATAPPSNSASLRKKRPRAVSSKQKNFFFSPPILIRFFFSLENYLIIRLRYSSRQCRN